MTQRKRSSLLLILSLQVVFWVTFLVFMDHLWLEIVLFMLTLAITIFFYLRKTTYRLLLLGLNPFLFLITFSFAQGVFSSMVGQPKLIFVSYQVDEGLFPEVNPEIANRVSIDPDFGWIDYLVALPNNVAVRLWTKSEGHLIDYRELSHLP